METTEEGQVKVANLTSEEILSRTIAFSKVLLEQVKIEASKLERPAPIAIILNSLMYIYLSIVLNTIPREMQKNLVEDHFARVMKDLNNETVQQSEQTVASEAFKTEEAGSM